MASYADKIRELIDKLQDIQNEATVWETDEGTIGPMDRDPDGTIDVDLDSVINDTINFWNTSVQELLNEFNKETKGMQDGKYTDENGVIHHTRNDAGHSFTEDPYAVPDPNVHGEKYLENRTDEIDSVLKNDEKLDYTIKEMEAWTTRLLMPQYARRVEVEDLNRNFWVIGQNLTMLNKFVLNPDGPLGKLLKELVGLWENIYRIWQAILYLAKKIDKVENGLQELGQMAAKTKVQLAYSHAFNAAPKFYEDNNLLSRLFVKNGDEYQIEDKDGIQVLSLTDNFEFKWEDINALGILPVLEKEEIPYDNKTGWLVYLPYNKIVNLNKFKIDGVYDDEAIDNLYINDKARGLIRIERKFGNRPAREILEDMKTRNYTLLAPLPKGKMPIIDNLNISHDPFLEFLQFYRDVLMYAYATKVAEATAAQGNSSVSFSTLREGFLNWLIFTKEHKWGVNERISTNIASAYKYIKAGFPNLFNIDNPFKGIESLNIDFKTFVDDFTKNVGVNMSQAIAHFYQVYETVADFLFKHYENNKYTVSDIESFPYFSANEGKDEYLIKNTNGINKFKDAYQDWSVNDSIDGNGTFANCPTYLLFSGCRNLFDLQEQVSFVGTSNITGSTQYFKINTPNGVTIPESTPILDWDLVSNELPSSNFHGTSVDDQYELNIDNISGDVFYGAPTNYLPAYNNGETDMHKRALEVMDRMLPRGGRFKNNEKGVFGCSYLAPWKEIFGLWFDFVKTASGHGDRAVGGRVRTFTANLFDGLSFGSNLYSYYATGHYLRWFNIYNTDVQITFSGNKNVPYWNFIRYRKPYPSIAALLHVVDTNGDYIKAINNKENVLYYDQCVKNENGDYDGQLEAVDGFLGFISGIDYPSATSNPRLSFKPYDQTYCEIVNNDGATPHTICRFNRHRGSLNYFGPMFKHSKAYTVASTDLINAHTNTTDEVKEGYTRWTNTNLLENPSISISYLPSDTEDQQLSIFISKDKTTGDWRIPFVPPEEFALVDAALIDDTKLRADAFIYDNKLYNTVVGEDGHGGSTLAQNYDLLYSVYNNAHFYRMRTYIDKDYNAICHLKGTNGQDLDGSNLLSSGAYGAEAVTNRTNILENNEAINYILGHPTEYPQPIEDGQSAYYIVQKNVYNRISSKLRQKTDGQGQVVQERLQMAGIYIGKIVKLIRKNGNIESSVICTINKVLAPNMMDKSRVYNPIDDNVVFGQNGTTYYGHMMLYTRDLTEYNPADVANENKYGWRIIAKTVFTKIPSNLDDTFEGYVYLVDAVRYGHDHNLLKSTYKDSEVTSELQKIANQIDKNEISKYAYAQLRFNQNGYVASGSGFNSSYSVPSQPKHY